MKNEQQERDIRERWFKDHKASVLTQGEVATIINWANPESWNFGCRYIIHRRWLTVVGDIGEAVYEWSQDLTLPFLAGLDFGYFHGKCQASETGRNYTQWDSVPAYESVRRFLAEQDAEDHPGENDDWREHLRNLTAQSAKDEFEHAIHKAYSEGLDPECASMFLDAGTVPNIRALGHFIGLQMALEQLNKKT